MLNCGTRGGQLLALARGKAVLKKTNDRKKLSSVSTFLPSVPATPEDPFVVSPKRQRIDDPEDGAGNSDGVVVCRPIRRRQSSTNADIHSLLRNVNDILGSYKDVLPPCSSTDECIDFQRASVDVEPVENDDVIWRGEQKAPKEKVINVQHPSQTGNEDFIDEHVKVSEERKIVVSNEDTVVTAAATVAAEEPAVPKKRKKAKKTKEEKVRPLLEACGASCRRKCTEKIDEERRKSIHKQYWDMDYDRQRDWILSKVEVVEVKQVKVNEEDRKINRSISYEYFLSTSERDTVQVCQYFFLRTLGYTSNKKLVYLFKKTPAHVIASMSDERGKQAPGNKIKDEVIKAIDLHISSANPSSSHYRRKHAPLRLYLPSELNVSVLHRYFIESNPEMKVTYEIYRQRLNRQNISFAKLGLEDCEACLAHSQHIHRGIESKFANNGVDFVLGKLLNKVECSVDQCKLCSDHQKHTTLYQTARAEYQKDKKNILPDDSVIAATDMQKVIMLPRMPGIKTCIFTKRLTTYHMTFAPVGGVAKNNGRPVGVIWHDAIRGRKDEDVTSTYVKYVRYMRDKKNITLWVDNCSAQNKNWTLFTTLCLIVNSPSFNCDNFTLKYFEPGHTFMAADAFHKEIEDGMRMAKNVYDFLDFERIIQSKGIAVQMDISDFQQFESKQSKAKHTFYPYLHKIVVAKFEKGSSKLYWKENMSDKNFQSGNFLQKKFVKVMSARDPFPYQKHPKGFPQEKKDDVLKKLCPLMAESRRVFWQNLPVGEENQDDN